MIGNNSILLYEFLNNSNNPIKEDIKNHTPEQVIRVIVEEYWKEWKNKLAKGSHHRYECKGLGFFTLEYSKSKSRLRYLINSMRRNRRLYPDTVNVPNTRANGLQEFLKKEFRVLWKQIDAMKHEHIAKMNIINKGYFDKGEFHKIKYKYE